MCFKNDSISWFNYMFWLLYCCIPQRHEEEDHVMCSNILEVVHTTQLATIFHVIRKGFSSPRLRVTVNGWFKLVEEDCSIV